jgi:hypothetical protein
MAGEQLANRIPKKEVFTGNDRRKMVDGPARERERVTERDKSMKTSVITSAK